VTDLLVRITIGLNTAANALGRLLLAPIGVLPGWLSATIVSVATGVLLLILFKYTSRQRAIQRVRNDINAHLLALKLFKDSISVILRAQGRVFRGAGRLLVLAIVPMLVMIVPVWLLLVQLSLWYQYRPLRVGEEAVITLKLNDAAKSSWPAVKLRPTDAVAVTIGPVRVLSRREVCWNIKGARSGQHRLEFQVGNAVGEKALAISDRFLRASQLRPGWDWWEILENPDEEPFRPDSPIRSIAIAYPHRSSWTSGTDWWVVYWFIASLIAALCLYRFMNVNI
jgi:hypothetical protein